MDCLSPVKNLSCQDGYSSPRISRHKSPISTKKMPQTDKFASEIRHKKQSSFYTMSSSHQVKECFRETRQLQMLQNTKKPSHQAELWPQIRPYALVFPCNVSLNYSRECTPCNTNSSMQSNAKHKRILRYASGASSSLVVWRMCVIVASVAALVSTPVLCSQ